MAEVTSSPYVEARNRGYYVAGTRVSLASVIHAFRQGASPETILQDFPHVGSLAKVYGAIAFILENPGIAESYLNDQEQLGRISSNSIRYLPRWWSALRGPGKS